MLGLASIATKLRFHHNEIPKPVVFSGSTRAIVKVPTHEIRTAEIVVPNNEQLNAMKKQHNYEPNRSDIVNEPFRLDLHPPAAVNREMASSFMTSGTSSKV